MREGKDTLVVVDIDTCHDGRSGGEVVVGFAQWKRPWSVSSTKGEGLSDGLGEDEGEDEDENLSVPGLDREALVSLEKLLDTETRKVLGPEGHKDMWCMWTVDSPDLL